MPRALPTKSTSLRGWRVFTSSPSARPGKRWPPVPPPATRSLIGHALVASWRLPVASSSLRPYAALQEAAGAAADGQQDSRGQTGGDDAGHSVGEERKGHAFRLGQGQRQ